MGRTYAPPRLEQPPVTFHRPVGLAVADMSLSALVCAGCKLHTSVEPPWPVIHRPVELTPPIDSRGADPSVRSAGSMYVPPRLEQPPATFHHPLGATSSGNCCASLHGRAAASTSQGPAQAPHSPTATYLAITRIPCARLPSLEAPSPHWTDRSARLSHMTICCTRWAV